MQTHGLSKWWKEIGNVFFGTHTMSKKGVLQLALQFNFWVADDTCNSLYLYAMSNMGFKNKAYGINKSFSCSLVPNWVAIITFKHSR